MAKKSISKAEALELAINSIQKKFGKESIHSGTGSVSNVEYYTTGCISIDRALGGGFAQGRLIEIFGPESSGKTTLALHAVAEAQAQDLVCAFVDAEHALDPKYAANLGVNLEELLISQPDNGEEALQITESLVRSGAVSIIVIDSVAALVPKAELEGDVGDSHVGRQARLMGQAMRMLAGAAYNTGTTIIFLNQLRMKVGIMFGNPETTPGGNALKFYASQRVDIRRKSSIKEGNSIVANETKIRVVKNKTAAPFAEAEFHIRYGEGIDRMNDIVSLAIDKGLFERAGTWYKYKEQNVCQGKPALVQYLKDNLDFRKKIIDQVTGTVDAKLSDD